MNTAEIQELKRLLKNEIADRQKLEDPITDAFIRLTHDTGHLFTTEAELLVYGIPRQLVPTLQVSYLAYEELLDLGPGHWRETRTTALLEKARSIVPPIESYGHKIPFETGNSDPRTFQWFAKTFFDVSNRHAFAMYFKRSFNYDDITAYRDERHSTRPHGFTETNW